MRKTLAADVNLGTTLALLSGLGWYAAAGVPNRFRYVLDFTVGATADGVLFHPDGPALTRLNYTVSTPTAAATETVSHGNTAWKGASTTAVPPTTAPLSGIAIVEGIVTPSSDGFVNIWGIVEAAFTGTPKLNKGSYVDYGQN